MAELAREVIIDVKASGQTVGIPAAVVPFSCGILPTVLIAEQDQASSQDGNDYTFTGVTLGAPGITLFSSLEAFAGFDTAEPFIEVYVLPGYSPGAQAFATFGGGLSGSVFAVAIEPNTAGPNTGSLIGLSETTPPITGLDIPADAVIQIRIDLAGGQIIARDESDNIYIVETFPIGSFPVAAPLWYVFGGRTLDLGDTITANINAGSSEATIDTENATRWCQFTPAVPYLFWTILTDNDTTFENDNRVVVNTKTLAGAPRFSGAMSWPLVAPVPQFDGNLFECEIIQRDADTLDDVFRVGADAFLNSQLTIDLDTFERLEIFSQGFQGNRETILCNNLTPGAGEMSAVAMFEPTPNDIRLAFCTNIGGSLVFYDPIAVPPRGVFPGLNVELTPFMQAWDQSFVPDGNISKIQYNGIDADLSVSTYPDNFKAFDGSSLPTKTAPYTRSARFEELTYYEQADGSPYIGPSFLQFSFTNGVTAPSFAYTQSTTFFNMEGVVPVATMVRINQTTFGASSGYYFGLVALNRTGSLLEFYVSAGDLRFRSDILGVQTDALVSAGWVPANGDVLGIAADALSGQCLAVLGRGPVVVGTFVPLAFDNHPDAVFMPRAGHNAVPIADAFTMDCQYKAADMDQDVVASFLSGPFPVMHDLEGSSI